MRARRLPLLLSLLLAACLNCAAAGLHWIRDRVELAVDNTVEVVHANFPYRNDGSSPVRVLVARPSCDCLVAGRSAFTVAPGASGSLEVSLRILGQVGAIRKELWVATDAPGDVPERLELDVTVSERVAVRPRMLFWTRGESSEPKLVSVSVSPAGAARLVGVRGPASGFVVATQPGKEGGTWQLRIRPSDTRERRSAVAAVEFAGADGVPSHLDVYLVVR